MKLTIVLMSLGVFVSEALAADKSLAWPRFRGPNGSGVADHAKPPVEFGPDKNVKWKVPVPSGLSSPIIAADSSHPGDCGRCSVRQDRQAPLRLRGEEMS